LVCARPGELIDSAASKIEIARRKNIFFMSGAVYPNQVANVEINDNDNIPV
jgi:hypothetical protein